MKIAACIILSVMAMPSIASAQRTTCSTIGNVTNCDTQQNGGVDYGVLTRSDPGTIRRDPQRELMNDVWVKCRRRWGQAIEARDFELANAIVKGCPATPSPE